jgi:hypothetical protein
MPRFTRNLINGVYYFPAAFCREIEQYEEICIWVRICTGIVRKPVCLCLIKYVCPFGILFENLNCIVVTCRF